jgi:hypothetical protein
MPRKFASYDPDWIDVNTQLTALGEDYGVRCVFTVTVERDSVQLVAKCYAIAGNNCDAPVVQALARKPIKSRPQLEVMCFATAQDCWRQLDRGTLGASEGGVTYGYNGRPNIARRDKRSE